MVLTDTISADLTAYYEEGDGSVRAWSPAKMIVAAFERSTVRSKILFKPSDDTKIALTLEHRTADDPTANYTSAYEGLSDRVRDSRARSSRTVRMTTPARPRPVTTTRATAPRCAPTSIWAP